MSCIEGKGEPDGVKQKNLCITQNAELHICWSIIKYIFKNGNMKKNEMKMAGCLIGNMNEYTKYLGWYT